MVATYLSSLPLESDHKEQVILEQARSVTQPALNVSWQWLTLCLCFLLVESSRAVYPGLPPASILRGEMERALGS